MPLEKLTGLQLVKKFPAFHGTRRFITALTSVRHPSLSWASPIQSIYPHPTSWRSILILSTHLRLGLPSAVFPSGFPSKTLYIPLSSPIRATCPAHLIHLDFITRTILSEEYKSFSSLLCNLLNSPVSHTCENCLHILALSQSRCTNHIYNCLDSYVLRTLRESCLNSSLTCTIILHTFHILYRQNEYLDQRFQYHPAWYRHKVTFPKVCIAYCDTIDKIGLRMAK